MEQCVGQLEDAYQRLATKVDLSGVETKLAEVETGLAREIDNYFRWMVGLRGLH